MLAASLSDLLDELEDPVHAANQMIREIEQGIATQRTRAAEALATSTLMKKRLTKVRAQVRSLGADAEVAVATSDDDTARNLLKQRAAAKSQVGQLDLDLRNATLIAEELRGELHKLEDKVQEARRIRDTLMTKRQAAVRQSAASTRKNHPPVRPQDIIDGFDTLSRLEAQLDAVEARHEADAELAAEKHD